VKTLLVISNNLDDAIDKAIAIGVCFYNRNEIKNRVTERTNLTKETKCVIFHCMGMEGLKLLANKHDDKYTRIVVGTFKLPPEEERKQWLTRGFVIINLREDFISKILW